MTLHPRPTPALAPPLSSLALIHPFAMFTVLERINKRVLTSCAHGDTICPAPLIAQAPRAPPSRRYIAVISHAEYVYTLTAAAALRVKTALSKAAW